MIKRETLELLLIFSVVFITTQLIDTYFFSGKKQLDLIEDTQESQPAEISKKTFSSELIDISFDESSGVLTDVALHQYPRSKSDKTPSQTLFTNEDGSKAQNLMSSLMIVDSKKQYMTEGVRPEELVVTSIGWAVPGKQVFVEREGAALTIKELYTIDGYIIKKQTTVTNKNSAPVSFFYAEQLMNRGSTAQPGTIPGTRMFHGASFHTPAIAYEKLPLSKFEKKPFKADAQEGWMSFSERYFVTAGYSHLKFWDCAPLKHFTSQENDQRKEIVF